MAEGPGDSSSHGIPWRATVGVAAVLAKQTLKATKKAYKFVTSICTQGEDLDEEMKKAKTCDFLDLIKLIDVRLHTLHRQLDNKLFSEILFQHLQLASGLLAEQSVSVGVFGEVNCGKSTLMNAFLGDVYLPRTQTSETSLKVRVTHSSSIHNGFCPSKCRYLDSSEKHTNNPATATGGTECPILVLSDGCDPIRGRENIHSNLSDLNSKVRHKQKSLKEVILKMSIPLLTERVPVGWTVTLDDNPGFNEANKRHIQQLSEASVACSAAYIFLTTIDRMQSTATDHFLKSLLDMDNGSFNDGRLLIGITKFDNNYNVEEDEKQFSVDETKQLMREVVKECTGMEISKESVVVFSGKSALVSSKLRSLVDINHLYDPYQKRLSGVIAELKKYPDTPCGEGDVGQHNHSELIRMLDKACGFEEFTERVKWIVGNGVKFWHRKCHSNYGKLMDEAARELGNYETVLKKKVSAYKTEQREWDIIYKSLQDECQLFEEELQKDRDTDVYKKIVKAFKSDIEDTNVHERVLQKVSELKVSFQQQCVEQICGDSALDPNGFNNGVHSFLVECKKIIEKTFGDACRFTTLRSVSDRCHKDVRERFTILCSKANELCDENFISKQFVVKHGSSEVLGNLTFEEIKTSVGDTIPTIRLNIFGQFLKMCRDKLWPEFALSNREFGEWCRRGSLLMRAGTSQITNLQESEVDTVVTDIHQQLQDKCKAYFQDVENSTIKFYFTQYCDLVKHEIKTYDTYFKEKLNSERKRRIKVIKDVEDELTFWSSRRRHVVDLKTCEGIAFSKCTYH